MDAKCRWRSNRLDGAGSNRELLGQRKGMKIHMGAITHKICCLADQCIMYCKGIIFLPLLINALTKAGYKPEDKMK